MPILANQPGAALDERRPGTVKKTTEDVMSKIHIESTYEMPQNYCSAEKLSGCRIGNGNYKNVYSIGLIDNDEMERTLQADDGVVEYYYS